LNSGGVFGPPYCGPRSIGGHLRGLRCVVVIALGIGAVPDPGGAAQLPTRVDQPTLAAAQQLFYDARYEEAAALTLAVRSAAPEDLAVDELRTSALLFQLKALLERRPDRDDALAGCAICPGLVAEFLAEIRRGQTRARAALASNPDDNEALFFLGKLDLNYVWLQLGPLRRKTGWDEYWEARRSLDAVLKRDPQNVRARVARAWISYIVDTRMPWGARCLLGGGNKRQALADVRAASQMNSDFFTHAESEFALWNMEVREHNTAQATEVARRLAHDFPDNRELAAFLEGRQARTRP
jgi:hypothetical protein